MNRKFKETVKSTETGKRERTALFRMRYLLDLPDEELRHRAEQADPDAAMAFTRIALSIEEPEARRSALRGMQAASLLGTEIRSVEAIENLVNGS